LRVLILRIGRDSGPSESVVIDSSVGEIIWSIGGGMDRGPSRNSE
jgi:hypothetical protein